MRNGGSGPPFNGIARRRVATAQFTLTDANASPLEVRWSWWGREQYFYKGQLLESLWDLTTLTGDRKFRVDGHEVRIAWAAEEDFVTRVYVDGSLRIDNLFPHLVRTRKPFSWVRWLKTVAIWMAIGAIATFAYKSWQSRPHVRPNKSLEQTGILTPPKETI